MVPTPKAAGVVSKLIYVLKIMPDMVLALTVCLLL